jgi:catechol 2,3-dioxygenase-like lactoylglutathione lyase family enzyme
MKRFHVHVAVPDLQGSIRFYSTMFGAEPTVVKDDYAKWMLEDPRVNFAISQRGGAPGINHLGFQVDQASELEDIHSRLQAADASVTEEKNVSCCYARSDKYWITDPAGVPWESFHSLGTVPFYNGERNESAAKDACCAPSASGAEATSCCAPSTTSGKKAACCS